MGQFDQRQTCPHCGVLMVLALPPGGKGARVLQCLACDRPDPIEMGTLLRYPYEVRAEGEYFDDIQDVKITKDMLDLAKHIVEQKVAEFDPAKFEDRYEAALTELINQKRNGRTAAPKARPRGDNVVDLMDALKRSLAGGRKEAAPTKITPAKAKRRKSPPGQEEMLLPNRRYGRRGQGSSQESEQVYRSS